MEEKEISVSKILLRIPFIDSQSRFRSGYKFKPIWGAYRRRSNVASNSKSQSQSRSVPHIPILNLKRKRDYGFLPDLLANAKPHVDVGSDLNENPKPHKIKRLKIIPPKKPPNSCSVTPIWFSFDALVEVASLEIEKFDKFARLIQEKALKKPIFIQEKVKSAAVQKRPRFGHDDDDQDWGLELETKKQRAMVGQEKVMGSAFSVQDWGLGLVAKKKKQFSMPIKKAIAGPHPPPILPPEFKDVINTLNGRDELLVIQKTLFKTDITKGNNRFSIPLRQIVREDFLSEQEKEELRVRQGIPARLIDPKLQIFNDVVLVRWDMPKITGNTTSTFALRTGWNNVRLSNDLKEGDLVQLWSFRIGQQACEDASSSTATNKGQLCFALVLL